MEGGFRYANFFVASDPPTHPRYSMDRPLSNSLSMASQQIAGGFLCIGLLLGGLHMRLAGVSCRGPQSIGPLRDASKRCFGELAWANMGQIWLKITLNHLFEHPNIKFGKNHF